MKFNGNAIQNKLNPLFFYLALMLHNYIIKKTNNSLVFIFSFVPPSIYVLLKTTFGNFNSLLSFPNIFFGILLGLFDFLIILIYSQLMLNSSCWLCQTFTILPILLFLLRFVNLHSVFVAVSIFITSLSLRELSNFERTGSKSSLIQLPFIMFLMPGDIAFFFILIIFLRFFISFIIQRHYHNHESLFITNMFFLSFISLLYTLFDYTTKLNATEALNGVKTIAAVSCCFYIIFLLTLESVGRQKHVFYSLYYLVLNCFYFLSPKAFIFQNTRVENELYSVYLGMFLCVVLIMAYVLFWYFYEFKGKFDDYENQRNVYQLGVMVDIDEETDQQESVSNSGDEEAFV